MLLWILMHWLILTVYWKGTVRQLQVDSKVGQVNWKCYPNFVRRYCCVMGSGKQPRTILNNKLRQIINPWNYDSFPFLGADRGIVSSGLVDGINKWSKHLHLERWRKKLFVQNVYNAGFTWNLSNTPEFEEIRRFQKLDPDWPWISACVLPRQNFFLTFSRKPRSHPVIFNATKIKKLAKTYEWTRGWVG